MAEDNRITAEEKRKAMLNVYFRSSEELLAPFQNEVKDVLEVGCLICHTNCNVSLFMISHK